MTRHREIRAVPVPAYEGSQTFSLRGPSVENAPDYYRLRVSCPETDASVSIWASWDGWNYSGRCDGCGRWYEMREN